MGWALVLLLLGAVVCLSSAQDLTVAEYEGIHGPNTTNATTLWPNGYETAFFVSEAQSLCSSSWINIPGINMFSAGARGFLYFLALSYCFVGISIIADIFMSAVEQICAKEKTITMADGRIKSVPVWNQTVANLSLMSLGCSSPEIMLSIITSAQSLGQTPSELGPGTIVGSAAFNLLMITSVCIVSLPGEQVKSISDIGVFCVTASWAVGVYLWMFIVLDVWTPGVVTLVEAWITLLSMVAFVGMAYLQDRNWFRSKKTKPRSEDSTISISIPDGSGGQVSLSVSDYELGDGSTASLGAIKRHIKRLGGDVSAYADPDILGSVKGTRLSKLMSSLGSQMKQPVKREKSSIWYKINARRGLAGRKHVVTVDEAEAYHREHPVESDLAAFTEAARRQQGSRASSDGYWTPPQMELEDGIDASAIEESFFSVTGHEPGPGMSPMGNMRRSDQGDPTALITSDRNIRGESFRAAFTSHEFRVMENAGTVRLAVRRSLAADEITPASVVTFETHNGEAVDGIDFVATKGELHFAPGESIKTLEIEVKVNDDNEIPNRSFTVVLTNHRASNLADKTAGSFLLGARSLASVVIMDDHDPGMLAFEHASFSVLETASMAEIRVVRTAGMSGTVTVDYKTSDGSAVAGLHFEHTAGTLVFESNQTEGIIHVPLKTSKSKLEANTAFHLTLSNPTHHATLGRQVFCIVHIKDDKAVEEVASALRTLFLSKREAFGHATSSWRQNLLDALQPQGGVDEHGRELKITLGDLFMHHVTVFWKLVFCLVPPTAYLGGWLTFVVSLIGIGVTTSITGEVASLFGCAVGLKDGVTAISFVAIGTSLPDLFASRTAAREAKDADAAISNACGTTTNNVLLGLGFPWVIGATYYHVTLGQPYCVPSGELAYTVMIFTACAAVFVGVIFLRRWLVGGELGGKAVSKWSSSLLLAALWVFYILMSSLQAYGYIGSLGTVYELDNLGCRVSEVQQA